ncbi:MAG: hypothetical protein WCR19_06590 [Acholeplasmataceae bacterium]
MPSDKQVKGDAYEDFSRQILLLENITWNNDGIVFDKVESLSKIQGKSGAKHQIDIHLTSIKFQRCHLICECKNYTRPVEKSLGCSFITVIHDIKEEHPEWVVIGAFLSNKGFNSGAVKVLSYYEIAPLYLEDVSSKTFKLTITESSTRAIISVKRAFYSDDSEVDLHEYFRNDDLGGFFRIGTIVGFYTLYDEQGELIKDIINYIGNFKTGERELVNNEDDCFFGMTSGKELKSIEGIIEGKKTTSLGSHSSIIKSIVKGILRESKDVVYHFNKDGGVKKIDYSKVSDDE